jgi:hypothetical protein
MATPWPVELQQLVNEDSFSFDPGDTTIRTDMDYGPVKVRRRHTRSVDTFSVTINCDMDQVEDLLYFYQTTLNGGVDRFEFDHPIFGTTREFRFIGPPSYKPLGGINFIASMKWELMPE